MDSTQFPSVRFYRQGFLLMTLCATAIGLVGCKTRQSRSETLESPSNGSETDSSQPGGITLNPEQKTILKQLGKEIFSHLKRIETDPEVDSLPRCQSCEESVRTQRFSRLRSLIRSDSLNQTIDQVYEKVIPNVIDQLIENA